MGEMKTLVICGRKFNVPGRIHDLHIGLIDATEATPEDMRALFDVYADAKMDSLEEYLEREERIR